ncbi:MAG: phage integrase N-terminal SAM-like domain-containing protein [Alphaproteobacteria bacterium]
MLLDEMFTRIRRLNCSIRTERLRRLGAAVCLVHVRRHPRDMGATEIEVFLTHFVIAGKASASIRNPAKRAPQFFIGRC